MKSVIIFSSLLAVSFCGQVPLVATIQAVKEEIVTPPPPPQPYAFGYAAGRFPGHIDRTHSEISDGSGVVQGSYSYVDPRHKIRTVQYIADENGFRSISNDPTPDLPSDTPVVAAAKERHLQRYASIANAHQAGPSVFVPADTKAVQYAKNKHLSLYQKIAEEHARLAAEAEAVRKAEEATAVPNSLDHY